MAQHILREEQFDFNRSQFKAIADTAIDAIISINSVGKVIFFNYAAHKMFGYKPNEINGQNITKIIPRRYRFAHSNGIKKYLATGKTSYIGNTIELHGLRKNGTEFPLELSVTTWKTGNKDFFSAIIRDVSTRKQEEYNVKKSLDTERKIADKLQNSLLPKQIPQIKGLEISSYYQSATEKAQVGGDFYDFFQISKNEYGVVMGDVAGKGVDVAVETATIKSLLRDKAITYHCPSKVLENLNNSLIKMESEHFIALTYAIYSTDTSVLRIANAGNPYPYLTKNDQFLKITSVPVSIIEKETYPIKEIKLDKDNLLVMFTDGLTEARYKHKLFGEERVRAFIKKNKRLSLGQIIQTLIREARKFSHDNLPDDIVLVGMKKL